MKTMMTIASLIALVIVCGSIDAQPKEPKLPDGGRWQKPIVGLGVTLDKAKDDALAQAAKVVTDLMLQQSPPLQAFKVDKDYVHQKLLSGDGMPGKDDEVKVEGQKEVP